MVPIETYLHPIGTYLKPIGTVFRVRVRDRFRDLFRQSRDLLIRVRDLFGQSRDLLIRVRDLFGQYLGPFSVI